MSNPVVLVTGALAGIGRATAIAFAREGARVVVSGRNDEAGAAHAPVKTTGGLAPTNLTFGGADGRDVFVTQADKNNILIERFRTDRPGRELVFNGLVPNEFTIRPSILSAILGIALHI